MKRLLRHAATRFGNWCLTRRGEARTLAVARDFVPLVDDARCAVFLDDQPGNRCLVSFTGVGHGPGGIEVPRLKFLADGDHEIAGCLHEAVAASLKDGSLEAVLRSSGVALEMIGNPKHKGAT